MKYRTILVILALSTFTLFGCGKTETNIPETSIEEEITDTTTDVDESNKEADAEVLETDATESMLSSDTSPLDPSNITVNPDGTYSFTDDFLVAVQAINGAAGLTADRLDIALHNAAEAIINMGLDNEQDIISTIETEIAIQEYDQFKEQANQGGGNSNNGGSQQTQQTQNQGGNTSSGNGEDQVAPGPVDEVGAMDDVIAGLLQEEMEHIHGAGDGTHVGTGH